MFAGLVTHSSVDQIALDNYWKNTKEIFQRIENQFIRAVKEINNISLNNGSTYTIFFTKLLSRHGKGEVFERKVLKKLTSFEISVTDGPLVDYEFPLSRCDRNKTILFLGKITPFLGKSEDLKQMAAGESQEISQFEDVFSYWFRKLSEQINFCQQNGSKILDVKEKINNQFIRAIEETYKYVQDGNFKPVTISPTNFVTSEIPLHPDKLRFEPLKKYHIYTIKKIHSVTYFTSIGTITLIENIEKFKEVIQREPQNFERLSYHYFANMKQMIDEANVSLFSSYISSCALL